MHHQPSSVSAGAQRGTSSTSSSSSSSSPPSAKPPAALFVPLPAVGPSLRVCLLLAALFALARSHRDLRAAFADGTLRARQARARFFFLDTATAPDAAWAPAPAPAATAAAAAAAADATPSPLPPQLPPPLPSPLRGAGAFAAASQADPLRPDVLAAHVRVPLGTGGGSSSPTAELTLFLAGTALGWMRRNFSVAGCLLTPLRPPATAPGDVFIPATMAADEIVHCVVPVASLGLAPHPAPGRPDVRVSAVLHKNAALRRALREPVELAFGHVATLAPGDVSELPRGVDMSAAPRLQAGDLLAVRSNVTVGTALVERDAWVPAAAASGKSSTSPQNRTKAMVPGDVRYRTCLVTQVHDPAVHFLPPWIEYHRRVGVDMVYLFDNQNRSAPASRDLAAAFAHRSDVAVIPWPWQRSQVQAFTYFQRAARARCKWTIYSDVDEYVMVGLDGYYSNGTTEHFGQANDSGSGKAGLPPLARYLESNGKLYRQVSFPYLTMVNSGYHYSPAAALPEAYVHRETAIKSELWKTACCGDCEWSVSGIHFCRFDGHSYAAEQRLAPRVGGSDDVPARCMEKYENFMPANLTRAAPRRADADAAFLVHFKFRSWEDMVSKFNGPEASMFAHEHAPGRAIRHSILAPPTDYLKLKGRKDVAEFTAFRDMYRRVVGYARWRPTQDIVVRVGRREAARRISIHRNREKDEIMESMLKRVSKQ